MNHFIQIQAAFLAFATGIQRKNSISYAASFGIDEWEGNAEETVICGRMLREFKAVSVREHSGVKICKDIFDVDAVQMPDPTLLLNSEYYNYIINTEQTYIPQTSYLCTYILDSNEVISEVTKGVATEIHLFLHHILYSLKSNNEKEQVRPSIAQWLRLIRDCNYFITDSFHGCVFSIIFNKPFVCLGNEGRGNARFDTLLGTFGLEDRLVTTASADEICRVLTSPIDWERVNAIHDAERERGINFLKENLTE